MAQRQGPTEIQERTRTREGEGTFDGFKPLQSNATFVPNDFFDHILPYENRGVVRVSAAMIRLLFGWSNSRGNPQPPKIEVGYQQLMHQCRMSKNTVIRGLKEAEVSRILERIRQGDGRSGSIYGLRWSNREQYRIAHETWDGFYTGVGCFTVVPNQYLDEIVPEEDLPLLRVVGTVIRQTIGWQAHSGGFRSQEAPVTYRHFVHGRGSTTDVARALKAAVTRGFLEVVEPAFWRGGTGYKTAIYRLNWLESKQYLEGVPKNVTEAQEAQGGTQKRHGTVPKNVTEGVPKNVTLKSLSKDLKQHQGPLAGPVAALSQDFSPLFVVLEKARSMGVDVSKLSSRLLEQAIEAVGVEAILEQIESLPYHKLLQPSYRYIGKFLHTCIADGKPWDPSPFLLHEKRRKETETERTKARIEEEAQRKAEREQEERNFQEWLQIGLPEKAGRILEAAWLPLFESKGLEWAEIEEIAFDLAKHIQADTTEYKRIPLYPTKIQELLNNQLSKRRRRTGSEHS